MYGLDFRIISTYLPYGEFLSVTRNIPCPPFAQILRLNAESYMHIDIRRENLHLMQIVCVVTRGNCLHYVAALVGRTAAIFGRDGR